LRGSLAMKGICGYPTTAWDRIEESEQTGDWLAALLEYGQLQYELPTEKGENDFAMPTVFDSPRRAVKFNNRQGSLSSRLFRSPTILQQTSSTTEHCLPFEKELERMSLIERGRMRCLLELGHLDGVIDQVFRHNSYAKH